MNNNVTQQTKYYSIRLPKVERFARTKKDIKNTFKPNILKWVSLGGISKQHEFDSRFHHRPNIKGHILASLTITRDNESYLCMYSIRKELYSEEAMQTFREEILQSMSSWLNKKLERSETSIIGYESLDNDLISGDTIFKVAGID